MKAVRRVCVVHHRLGGSLPAQAKEEEEEVVGGGRRKGQLSLRCPYRRDYLLSVLLSQTESSSIRRKEELMERMFRGGAATHVQIASPSYFFLLIYFYFAPTKYRISRDGIPTADLLPHHLIHLVPP